MRGAFEWTMKEAVHCPKSLLRYRGHLKRITFTPPQSVDGAAHIGLHKQRRAGLLRDSQQKTHCTVTIIGCAVLCGFHCVCPQTRVDLPWRCDSQGNAIMFHSLMLQPSPPALPGQHCGEARLGSRVEKPDKICK